MNLSPQNGYQTFIRNCDSVHSNGLKNTKENDKKIIFLLPSDSFLWLFKFKLC